jgi:hypothetical protein
MNDELERMWMEAGKAYLRYYPSIYLKVLRKTTINLSEYSLSSGRDLNPRPPEYRSTKTWLVTQEVYTVGCFVLSRSRS